jgi:hypothetical protein
MTGCAASAPDAVQAALVFGSFTKNESSQL